MKNGSPPAAQIGRRAGRVSPAPHLGRRAPGARRPTSFSAPADARFVPRSGRPIETSPGAGRVAKAHLGPPTAHLGPARPGARTTRARHLRPLTWPAASAGAGPPALIDFQWCAAPKINEDKQWLSGARSARPSLGATSGRLRNTGADLAPPPGQNWPIAQWIFRPQGLAGAPLKRAGGATQNSEAQSSKWIQIDDSICRPAAAAAKAPNGPPARWRHSRPGAKIKTNCARTGQVLSGRLWLGGRAGHKTSRALAGPGVAVRRRRGH